MKKKFLSAARTHLVIGCFSTDVEFGLLSTDVKFWVRLVRKILAFLKKRSSVFSLPTPPDTPLEKFFMTPPLDLKVYDPPLELGPLHTYGQNAALSFFLSTRLSRFAPLYICTS